MPYGILNIELIHSTSGAHRKAQPLRRIEPHGYIPHVVDRTRICRASRQLQRAGRIAAAKPAGEPNNADLKPNFSLGSKRANLTVTSDRNDIAVPAIARIRLGIPLSSAGNRRVIQ